MQHARQAHCRPTKPSSPWVDSAQRNFRARSKGREIGERCGANSTVLKKTTSISRQSTKFPRLEHRQSMRRKSERKERRPARLATICSTNGRVRRHREHRHWALPFWRHPETTRTPLQIIDCANGPSTRTTPAGAPWNSNGQRLAQPSKRSLMQKERVRRTGRAPESGGAGAPVPSRVRAVLDLLILGLDARAR